MNKIITDLENIGKDYFSNSFHFKQSKNLYIAKNNDMSYAINSRKHDSQKVNVINFFEDIWFYIEIKFIPKIDFKKIIPNICFSSSVFQGERTDEKKVQLFRAEWDNYDNFNDKHPQPHWHIYPHKYSCEVYETFEEFIDLGNSDPNFSDLINKKEINNNIIELNKFHFAMNGQWSDNKLDVHTISIENDLINWFKGLLNHLKKELEYLK